MKHMIAVNTKHTGDPSKDHRGYAEPMSSEQLDGLLSEDWLKKMVADIRAGNEKLKDDLPFACPHYMRFNNNHRAQADIIPETFTFMTCVDVDDREKVEQAIQRSLEVNSEEGGDWEGMVLRIDYSARKKVHIWVMMPVGKTIPYIITTDTSLKDRAVTAMPASINKNWSARRIALEKVLEAKNTKPVKVTLE